MAELLGSFGGRAPEAYILSWADTWPSPTQRPSYKLMSGLKLASWL